MNTPHLDTDLLIDGALHYGVCLDSNQVLLYERYFSLLCEWNNRVNLISRNDLSRFVSHHILDSLKAASVVDIMNTGRFCDFGSGSGVPGIPLAIAFPDCSVELIDSRRKRCDFLEHCLNEMELSHCSLVCDRAERYIADSHPVYDMVITRATCSLLNFFTIFQQCVGNSGILVSIKGSVDDNERFDLDNSVPRNRFSITYTHPVEYPPVRTGSIVIIESI